MIICDRCGKNNAFLFDVHVNKESQAVLIHRDLCFGCKKDVEKLLLSYLGDIIDRFSTIASQNPTKKELSIPEMMSAISCCQKCGSKDIVPNSLSAELWCKECVKRDLKYVGTGKQTCTRCLNKFDIKEMKLHQNFYMCSDCYDKMDVFYKQHPPNEKAMPKNFECTQCRKIYDWSNVEVDIHNGFLYCKSCKDLINRKRKIDSVLVVKENPFFTYQNRLS